MGTFARLSALDHGTFSRDQQIDVKAVIAIAMQVIGGRLNAKKGGIHRSGYHPFVDLNLEIGQNFNRTPPEK